MKITTILATVLFNLAFVVLGDIFPDANIPVAIGSMILAILLVEKVEE